MRQRRWLGNLDMYRRVPEDLMEGSKQGSILSWAAIVLMATLFFLETKSFLSYTMVTDLSLDQDKETRIKVNFNITMLDLKCEYATIDVVSVLGTEQNVTKNVYRWTVDEEGIRQRFVDRNLLQHDIDLSDSNVKSSVEELHENGEDAISLDDETFGFALDKYDYVFVDFYASWCSHCHVLAPTWETLAEVMWNAAEHTVDQQGKADYTEEEYDNALKVELPVLIAKVDCAEHHDLCMEEGITGYPTMRLYVEGERSSSGDYMGHRTVLAMTQFLAIAEEKHQAETADRAMGTAQESLKRKLNITEEERMWAEGLERTRHEAVWNAEYHPGCQLSGHLMLNRVPGNFYIQARSKSHDLSPYMTNVSHEIHELSFGDTKLLRHLQGKKNLNFPGKFLESTRPMDGNVYMTQNLHEAYHHYLKLIPTRFDNQIKGAEWKIVRQSEAYQVLQSSELAFYRNDVVPEAKFVIDLSPIAVSYRMKTRKWYDYLTSLMAIIGGIFTVVGFMESGMRTARTVSRKAHMKRPR